MRLQKIFAEYQPRTLTDSASVTPTCLMMIWATHMTDPAAVSGRHEIQFSSFPVNKTRTGLLICICSEQYFEDSHKGMFYSSNQKTCAKGKEYRREVGEKKYHQGLL